MDRYDWDSELPVTNTMGVPSRRLVWREPAGVVAAISPWHCPFQINMAKIAPALAAGCTVVLQSAPETPSTATILGPLMAEKSDKPTGGVNLLTSLDPSARPDQMYPHPAAESRRFTRAAQ